LQLLSVIFLADADGRPGQPAAGLAGVLGRHLVDVVRAEFGLTQDVDRGVGQVGVR
jgi:hypothetical protein